MIGDERDFREQAMREHLASYHALPFACTIHLDDGTGRTIQGRTLGKLNKDGHITVAATVDALPFDVLQNQAFQDGDYLVVIIGPPHLVDIHALEEGQGDG